MRRHALLTYAAAAILIVAATVGIGRAQPAAWIVVGAQVADGTGAPLLAGKACLTKLVHLIDGGETTEQLLPRHLPQCRHVDVA